MRARAQLKPAAVRRPGGNLQRFEKNRSKGGWYQAARAYFVDPRHQADAWQHRPDDLFFSVSRLGYLGWLTVTPCGLPALQFLPQQAV